MINGCCIKSFRYYLFIEIRIFCLSNQISQWHDNFLMTYWLQIIGYDFEVELAVSLYQMKSLLLQEIQQLKKQQDEAKAKSKQTKPLRIGYSPPPSQSSALSSTSSLSASISQRSQLSQPSQRSKTPSPPQIFTLLTFTFPLIDIDLSPKRVELLTALIQ